MKKLYKKFAALIAAVSAVSVISCAAPVYADYCRNSGGIMYRYSDSGESKGIFTGWARKGTDRYYYKDGKMVKWSWITVNGVKTYLLKQNGVMATGIEKVGDKYYSFGSDGKLIGEVNEPDETTAESGCREWSGEISSSPIKFTGTAPTAAEIKELVDREKVTIAFFVRTETPGAGGDIGVSYAGYCFVQAEDNTLVLDSVTLPVFTDGKIIGEVNIFRYEGELHYSVAAGGTRWARFNEIFSKEPGKKMAFVYVGELNELMISPDGTVYGMRGDEGSLLDGVADRYAKYATEYNTFCFSDMVNSGNYATVKAGVSNITLR